MSFRSRQAITIFLFYEGSQCQGLGIVPTRLDAIPAPIPFDDH
ncbi:hypothetical protein PAMC26577_31125 [Caballeronia sordidicola]|uniref:Uncharacterized protein n=1 Tax=Caballeronia sordidicola TaxID=196367 RepID=A0A242MDW6_CABSO|nr:hypothetical protein PAMC26577_31125 [Caballeronia sordidicola]